MENRQSGWRPRSAAGVERIMSGLSPDQLIHTYGLWMLFALVLLESTGLPLPGEAALVSAALYAGATHRFGLGEVIAVAFAGAVAGDTIGYAIGRRFGAPILFRYGRHFGLTPHRLAIGDHLFRRHGAKIVFFGRFMALLRMLAALLAGANRMAWRRFAIANALGGLAWASLFAGAAYIFGDSVRRVERPVAFALLAIALLLFAVFLFAIKRYENELAADAAADQKRRETPSDSSRSGA
jgi:membrane protein DedA with SNARE-associated domain